VVLLYVNSSFIYGTAYAKDKSMLIAWRVLFYLHKLAAHRLYTANCILFVVVALNL